jgi:hypothetical protein
MAIIMTGICGICDDGKEKRLAKRNPPLCGYHYTDEQRKKSAEKNKNKPKKAPKALKRTALTYKRKPTGELEIFQEIWNERPHESFINRESISYFDVSLFAHVLAKAQNRFPHFKLYKKCIVLITREQHYQWDNGIREDLEKLPEWDKMFKLEAELKEEYALLYAKNKNKHDD